jgi:putative ABC transport system permease protein
VALARRITEAVPGVEALDRQTAVASVPGTDAIRSSLGLLLGLAFVVVVVVIGFFFLIFTVQKADVFTLLLAMGTPARSLVGGLALQVVLVVGVGSLLATGLLAALATTGDRAFPISVDPGLALGTGATAVALSLLAALGAVRRIVRIDPAAAVRGGGGELA